MLRIENSYTYVKEAESAIRGYSLTRDERFLQPYESSFDSISSNLEALLAYSTTGTLHSIPLDSIRSLIQKRFILIEKQIEIIRTANTNDLQLAQQGRILTNQIKEVLYHVKSEEERILKSKIDANNASARFTSIFIISFSIVALTMAILAFLKTDKNYRRLKKVEGNKKFKKMI